MPSTSCPGCSLRFDFELHDMHTAFECSKCHAVFTPGGGIVAKESPEPAVEAIEDGAHHSPPPQRGRGRAPRQAERASSSEREYRPEPWFFRFLEIIAPLLIWVHIIGATTWVINHTIRLASVQTSDFGIALLVYGWAAYITFVSVLLICQALILLAVDIGRSLRNR